MALNLTGTTFERSMARLGHGSLVLMLILGVTSWFAPYTWYAFLGVGMLGFAGLGLLALELAGPNA